MPDNRPDPEKLLHRVQEEEQKKCRGKLKIYLGAAPGVGKTHQMLHDAEGERAKGLDVVIGVVESHGRKEIEAMVSDFEILPKAVTYYNDKELLEFDLDSALKRNPALMLMDEMAHSNAPTSRHKKRWQDIKELLEHGVDVYTTLNVQHIESLNDDISQIIQAPIKETVPDSMLDMTDTFELVDLPPEELLKRLEAGKIYIPKQAEIAAEHFFKAGNLIALREVALRVVAERVGSQVVLYRQKRGIKHIWPTKEKILVCIGPNLTSRKLIRAARRMATNLKIDWIAVFVNTPKMQSSEFLQNKAIQNLRFAEQLGATTQVLTGFDIVQETMNFAREQNVTQIMIWKNIRSRFRNFFFRDLADEIVRHCGEIDVYIMTGERSMTSLPAKKISITSQSWKSYGLGLIVVALATGFNFLFYPYLSHGNLTTVYLLGVMMVALSGEVYPALLTSVLSVFSYDFFFVPPFYSFAISNLEYGFTLIAMMLMSVIVSQLVSRIRKQVETARFAERQIRALHTLSRQLVSTRGIKNLLDIGTHYISDVFDCEVSVLLPEGDQLVLQKNSYINELSIKEQGIAKWAYDQGKMAGFGTDTLSFSNAMYIPLMGSKRTLGIVRIVPKSKRLLTPEQMYLLESCVNQIAMAVEA